MTSLRIAMACYPTYGGSGVMATELGLALARRGHEIHFLSYEHPIRLTEYLGNVFYHEVAVQEYPLFRYPPYALALATKMAEVADQRGLDVLHVHYAIPHCASAWMAREMIGKNAMKIVATLHGTDITIVGNDPAYRRVTRFCLEKSDSVTAVSDYLRQRTVDLFDLKRPIEVVPNFIDPDRFDMVPCPDASRIAESGEKIIVHVSNFRPVKRVHDIVHAVARIRGNVPVRLLMVGEGPDRPTAQALATDLGIDDRVHFLGAQDAVERILPCADVFVLPSRYESFGLAALEAMACGVPVVATAAGGIPEVVADGETGVLCPVGDIDALADALVRVLSDDEGRKRMGLMARRRAQEEFDIGTIVSRYESIYRDVLDA